MWSVLLPIITQCNVYINLNPQLFMLTLFYNVHKCYVKSRGLMAGNGAEKYSTHFLVENNNPCIISFLYEFIRGFVNPILNFNYL